MADKKPKFTLKEYEQLINDVLNSYFQEQNVTHDLEELGQVQMDVPPGYHRMPDTGELMLDSEMEAL